MRVVCKLQLSSLLRHFVVLLTLTSPSRTCCFLAAIQNHRHYCSGGWRSTGKPWQARICSGLLSGGLSHCIITWGADRNSLGVPFTGALIPSLLWQNDHFPKTHHFPHNHLEVSAQGCLPSMALNTKVTSCYSLLRLLVSKTTH